MSDVDAPNDGLDVLILAPVGQDAEVAAHVLAQAGFRTTICRDPAYLPDHLHPDLGAVVAAEEAMSESFLATMEAYLGAQPSWSELPLIFVADSRSSASSFLARFYDRRVQSTVTLLERPLHPPTLTTAVDAALRSRQRQYEVRDLVATLEREQEALRTSEQAAQDRLTELRTVYDTAPIGLAFFDTDLRYVSINDYLARLNGSTSEAHIGRTLEDMLQPSLSTFLRPLLEHVLDTERSVVEREFVGTPPGQAKTKLVFRISLYPVPRPKGGLRGVHLVAQDVTNLKHTERNLRQSQDRLRALNETLEHRVAERTQELAAKNRQVRRLATALTLAEQEERRRISMLLHNHLQQLLFGIRLKLKSLRNVVVPEGTPQVERLDEIVSEAMETMQSLTVELNPPVLRESGLNEAMAWLARHFEQHHGLRVHLDMPDLPRIGQELRSVLFQFVRELLDNVVHHAGTDEATLRIRMEDDRVVVCVEDQGQGFDPSAIVENGEKTQYGLHSIAERLLLLQGLLEVDSAPGEGSRLTLVVPF